MTRVSRPGYQAKATVVGKAIKVIRKQLPTLQPKRTYKQNGKS